MTMISDWRKRKERYRLMGSKCENCGAVYYPSRLKCVKCGSENLKPVELPRRGKILSYTIIYNPPKKFEKYTPYAVALIELVDGTRVLAQLTDIDFNQIKVGMEVEAVFRRLYEYGGDGHIVYGTKFRPIVK